MIQLRRNINPEECIDYALVKLETTKHLPGQPIVLNYLTDTGKVDQILAIGTAEGIGKECFKVVSLGGLNVVWGIVTEIADVADVANGEVYLWTKPDGTVHKIYDNPETPGTRKIEPLDPADFIKFINAADRVKYYWSSGKLRKEGDYPNLADFNNAVNNLGSLLSDNTSNIGWLQRIDKKVFPAVPVMTFADGTTKAVYPKGSAQEITLKVRTEKEGTNVSSACTYSIEVLGSSPKVVIPSTSGTITVKLPNVVDGVIKLTSVHTPTQDIKTTEVRVLAKERYYFSVVPSTWDPGLSSDKAMIMNGTFSSGEMTSEDRSVSVRYNIPTLKNRSILVIPTDFGEIKSILDSSGFDYINDYSRSEITLPRMSGLGETRYYVYKKGSDVIINDLKQIFNYVD